MSTGGGPRGNRGGRGGGKGITNTSTGIESEDRAGHADSTRGRPNVDRGSVDRGGHRGRHPSHDPRRGPGVPERSPPKRLGDDDHTSGDRIFR